MTRRAVDAPLVARSGPGLTGRRRPRRSRATSSSPRARRSATCWRSERTIVHTRNNDSFAPVNAGQPTRIVYLVLSCIISHVLYCYMLHHCIVSCYIKWSIHHLQANKVTAREQLAPFCL